MRNTAIILRRLTVSLAFALAALFSPAIPPTHAAERAPIIAVGDLHGDYEAYQQILSAAGLIDVKGKWSGGDTILVQLGDVPDRGPDTKKIIEHLMKLERQAAKKGGRVALLIGNHEAMNMTGDLRYVTPEEYAAFATSKSKRLRDTYFKANAAALAAFYRKRDPALTDDGVKALFEAETPLGYLEHRIAWGPAGKFGAWVASHDALLKVGDTLFVHGGVSAATAASSIDAVNESVRAALTAGGGAILEDEAGPLWRRAFTEETPSGEADLAAALAAYSVKRIVIGHTPQVKGVRALYGGRVIAADTGASRYYGGTRSFVRIDDSGVVANDNGVERKLTEGAE
ncbi:MAG: metallophosphoesterase [Parvularculaceae bacterium]|nr:metallophosphoesterase [Parvularculaceae bacterium]